MYYTIQLRYIGIPKYYVMGTQNHYNNKIQFSRIFSPFLVISIAELRSRFPILRMKLLSKSVCTTTQYIRKLVLNKQKKKKNLAAEGQRYTDCITYILFLMIPTKRTKSVLHISVENEKKSTPLHTSLFINSRSQIRKNRF